LAEHRRRLSEHAEKVGNRGSGRRHCPTFPNLRKRPRRWRRSPGRIGRTRRRRRKQAGISVASPLRLVRPAADRTLRAQPVPVSPHPGETATFLWRFRPSRVIRAFARRPPLLRRSSTRWCREKTPKSARSVTNVFPHQPAASAT
jgi:hypothetical protein